MTNEANVTALRDSLQGEPGRGAGNRRTFFSAGLLGWAKLRREASRARLEADKLRILHNIGTIIASSTDGQGVLSRVVEAAGFITCAEEASLLLLDHLAEELYLRAQKGLGEKYARGFRIKVEDSIAGEVIRTGKPQRLVGTSRGLKVVTGYIVNAIVYVPIVLRGTILGVLSVDNRTRDRAFTEEDERLLSVLAGYAAIALEKTRLLDELERREQMLDGQYRLGQLELSQQGTRETAGVVLYQSPERFPAEGLSPRHLATVINPYLNTLAEVQHIVDEIEGAPPSPVRVVSIAQDLPAVASVEGVRKAVDALEQTVTPRRQALAQLMARLMVREKDAAIEQAEAEAAEVRAWAAADDAERERLLAVAARHHAAVEGFQWERERLQRELQDQKIKLALDLVTHVNPDLPSREAIAYVVRLLPALEHLLDSPLHVATVSPDTAPGQDE
jgi:putative methionine-R-sulfoxide reductase with GAF domain